MATAKTVEMERFAFDVFEYTLSRFNMVVNVPLSKCSKNIYEQPEFLSVLSSGYITYQLKKRDTWIPIFEAKFNSNGLKKFQQISELLEELLKEMDRKPKRNPMGRIVTSLALINELIQFLYSKNRRLFLNDLASTWKNYFAGFEEEFEEAGGFWHLYSIHTEQLQVLNKIIEYFIPNYCNPYGKKEVSSTFIAYCKDPSLIDSLEEIEQEMESDIKTLAKSLGTLLAAYSRNRRRSGDKTKASGSLKNTGLGIRPHEELYRNSNPPLANKEASEEKLVASSVEEASVTAPADVQLQQKRSVKTSRKKLKGRRRPSTEISSPEGQSKALAGLTGSPISPECISKDRGGLTGSPFIPGGPWKCLSTLTGSPLTPEGRSKYRGGLSGSPLSPEEISKDRGAIIGSPLSPEGRSKDRGSPSGSPFTPEGISKDRGGLSGSPLTPEGRSKDRGAIPRSPLSPDGQSKGRGALANSPSSPQEQKPRRGSPRTPEGISRLEQKRLKHLQRKKPE